MITVLLAAWQGAAYIEEQLDSILRQTWGNERVHRTQALKEPDSEKRVFTAKEDSGKPVLQIMVSDDGSTDGTREILERYRTQYPEQIVLNYRSEERRARDLKDGISPAAGNFFWLLSQADDDYIMLSDQDDVWKEQKTERLLKEVKRLEALYGADHPVLVHSDMEVVDVNLKTIHKSFFQYQNCDPSRVELAEILVENSVTGGAVMMNRALLELLKDRPAACFMHDWWIALAASCFGTISCVNESLYLYRQHGNNTLGAKKTGSVKSMAERVIQMIGGRWAKSSARTDADAAKCASGSVQVEENYRKMAAQAHAFGKMYQDRMSDEQKAVLRAYLALRYQSPAGRLRNILKNKFFKSSWIQTLAQCVTIPRPDGGNWPI